MVKKIFDEKGLFGKLIFDSLKGSGKQLESRPQGKEIFEIVIEDVKPGCWKNYVAHQGTMMLMYIAISDSYIYIKMPI